MLPEIISLKEYEQKFVEMPRSPILQSFTSMQLYAGTLLTMIDDVKKFTDDQTPESIKQDLYNHICHFEQETKLAAVPAIKILTARYILCAVLDEAILQSQWGKNHYWWDYSLLSIFHNDTCGGERVFVLLDKAMKEKSFNLDILELIYFCLSLGFYGKYRILEDGEEKLSRLRQELWHLLRVEKTPPLLSLATIADNDNKNNGNLFRKAFTAFLPLFIVIIFFVMIYIILDANIHKKSVKILQQLDNITQIQTGDKNEI